LDNGTGIARWQRAHADAYSRPARMNEVAPYIPFLVVGQRLPELPPTPPTQLYGQRFLELGLERFQREGFWLLLSIHLTGGGRTATWRLFS